MRDKPKWSIPKWTVPGKPIPKRDIPKKDLPRKDIPMRAFPLRPASVMGDPERGIPMNGARPGFMRALWLRRFTAPVSVARGGRQSIRPSMGAQPPAS